MAKRNENKAIARQPIDTGFARFNQDSSQAETRLNEDKGLALGDLDRGFLRGTDDAAIGLARAGRENTQFGLDANAQRFYQANVPLGGAPRRPLLLPRSHAHRRSSAGPIWGGEGGSRWPHVAVTRCSTALCSRPA